MMATLYNFGYTCLASLSLICSVLLCSWPCLAHAQLIGDRELLRQIAIRHQTNLEALLTWRGEVEFYHSVSHLHTGKRLETNRTVSFVYDKGTNNYLFLAEHLPQTNGSSPKLDGDKWGGLVTSAGFYRTPPWNQAKQSHQAKQPLQETGQPRRTKRLLLLQESSTWVKEPGDFSPSFDALWYFKVSGLNIQERLMVWHDNPDTPGMPRITVSRQGNLVSVVAEKPTIALNRYVFDLDQGANPVEFGGEDPQIKELYTRSYIKVSNVWVPESATAQNTNIKKGEVNESKVFWKSNLVNERIPSNSFDVARLGIEKGDQVRDKRTGTVYTYGGSTIVSSSVNFWGRIAVIIVVLTTAGVVLLLARRWLSNRHLHTHPTNQSTY